MIVTRPSIFDSRNMSSRSDSVRLMMNLGGQGTCWQITADSAWLLFSLRSNVTKFRFLPGPAGLQSPQTFTTSHTNIHSISSAAHSPRLTSLLCGLSEQHCQSPKALTSIGHKTVTG